MKLLGETNPDSDAESKIIEAARAGVKVFYLASEHAGRGRPTKAFVKKLMPVVDRGLGINGYPKKQTRMALIDMVFTGLSSITVLTFGLLTPVLNGLLVWLASELVE